MSERSFPSCVAVRDRASGRYLVAGPAWSGEARRALLLDEADAVILVRRFLCEPDAVELVAVSAADDGRPCRAVA